MTEEYVGQLIYDQGTPVPSLDLGQPIVRCRDCEHYSDHEWVMITDVSDVCHFWHGEPTKVEPDGFCKWGVRRVDE